ncbi:MAG: hypothetical protein C5B49_07690 [Bdellovibrio sp.]|nr:MAG: hypothetical protein C5B49_07690 [Bdellovibrio sp.]
MKKKNALRLRSVGMSSLLFAALLSLVFFAACSTAPKTNPSTATANAGGPVTAWEAKAQIVNRESQRSRNMAIDFVAVDHSQLRIDVMGTFGTPVAAAVLRGEKLTYLLPRQKRFYQGPALSSSLKPLIGFDLEPREIFSILYGEALQGSDWTCHRELSSSLCTNAQKAVSIQSAAQVGQRRKVQITGTKLSLQLDLERIPPKDFNPTKAFSLNIPADYSLIKSQTATK